HPLLRLSGHQGRYSANGSPQPLSKTSPYHPNRLSRCALRSIRPRRNKIGRAGDDRRVGPLVLVRRGPARTSVERPQRGGVGPLAPRQAPTAARTIEETNLSASPAP